MSLAAPNLSPLPAQLDPTARARPARAGGAALVGLLVLVAIGKNVLADTFDPDAFWHLRVADQLLRDGIGPLVDTLSFASDKHPWSPYSWLAELAMKAAWDLGGYRATIVLTAACTAGFTLAVAAACRARAGSALAASVASAVGLFFALPCLSFRPVTFALAAMAVAVWLLHRDRCHPTRSTWLLLPLTVLIANLHLYAAVLAVAVLLWAAGSWFDDRPQFRRRAVLALLTAGAACCTPMLPGAIATALRYNNADPMVASNLITEMRPFYSGPGGSVALALVLGLAVLAFLRRRRLQVTDALLLLLGMVLLFRLGRLAPVFALLAMPTLALSLPDLSDHALSRRLVRWALGATLIAGVASIALRYPYGQSFDQWLNRNGPAYPVAAADFVQNQVRPTHRRLINEFNWGGYLAWRFGESWQVLMDGRTQLYSAQFWNSTHLGTPQARRELLRHLAADAAVLPRSESCLTAPLIDLGWHEVYRDELAVVLLPPTTPGPNNAAAALSDGPPHN